MRIIQEATAFPYMNVMEEITRARSAGEPITLVRIILLKIGTNTKLMEYIRRKKKANVANAVKNKFVIVKSLKLSLLLSQIVTMMDILLTNVLPVEDNIQ